MAMDSQSPILRYPYYHTEGLKAAEISVKEGMRVNMTLVFSQEQAAAVYAATLGAKKGDVFLSPFVGRLDDRGENGMDFIANTIKMYERGRQTRGSFGCFGSIYGAFSKIH